jgi:branched-chain amino acid transport system permease protein
MSSSAVAPEDLGVHVTGRTPGLTRLLGYAAVLAVTVLVATVPSLAGAYTNHIFILAFLAVGLAVSYRPLLIAGQVSLAHGAFYAVGAYGFAILAQKHGVSFWLAVPLAGVVASVASIVIGVPSLRTAGAYFFLCTFAFSVVITSLFQNFTSLTGGFAGISGIPYPPGITTEADFFYVALAACVVIVAIFVVLDRSLWGLELHGVGASPELAEAVGVSRFATLLRAFSVGAFFAGILGSFYASFTGFIAPQSFDLWLSVSILTAVIVGGVRHIWGGVLGAAFVTLVPLLFHWKGSGDAIFGAVCVIVVMFVMRRGIATELAELLSKALHRAPAVPAQSQLWATAEDIVDERDPAVFAARPVVLDVRDIAKSFGGVRAVRGVSFTVHEGETLGLIGPNGSGKTTTFNLISGFARPDQGGVHLRGQSISTASPHHVVRLGLARSFQASAVFGHLSVFENVLLAVRSSQPTNPVARMTMPVRRRGKHTVRAAEVLAEVGLLDFADTQADALPYGHKKVLGLAVGLATNPAVLCLDEPATGMTDVEIAHLTTVLRRVRANHDVALVIIEHRLAVIRELCDRVVALRSGEVIAEGSPRDVLEAPEVMTAFLGASAA